MNKKKPFISIIITNYNKEKYIYEAIKSAKKQKYNNKEIIVVDNCSTDNSYKIISKFKNIKILKNKSKGTGALNQIKSIQLGFKKSRGKIIFLLDGDDVFKTNKVRYIVEYFNKNSTSQAVCDTPLIYSNSKSIKFNYSKKRVRNDKIWPTTFPTSAISIKRRFLEDCFRKFKKKRFDLLEIDFRLCCIFSMHKNNYNVLNKQLTVYRQVNDGIMSGYLKFGRKWWLKRSEAFNFFIYIKNIYKKKYSFSIDFYITKIISKIIQWT